MGKSRTHLVRDRAGQAIKVQRAVPRFGAPHLCERAAAVWRQEAEAKVVKQGWEKVGVKLTGK